MTLSEPQALACGPVGLVPRSINTMTFADGACEGRSRNEEEAMQGHRRRRETQKSSATSISPKGGGGTASISLSLLLHDANWHRFVVASRTRRCRARHKRHHIYGARHLPTALLLLVNHRTRLFRIFLQDINRLVLGFMVGAHDEFSHQSEKDELDPCCEKEDGEQQ